MKANDNLHPERIILPIPHAELIHDQQFRFEIEVYSRFMRHLRMAGHSREEIRVLTSIQFVADMMNICDTEVAAALVQLGLRVPRSALPQDFLDGIDSALMRDSADHGGPSKCVLDLRDHWSMIGEDRFAAFRRYHPTLSIGLWERV